ncbi:MAG: threalose-6-phosphate phosphatase [Trizodia sp. TS-e1964]|nr:MAG: threalose-6-phosphate phosphatase [Trizodia sp. TS-e1964]
MDSQTHAAVRPSITDVLVTPGIDPLPNTNNVPPEQPVTRPPLDKSLMVAQYRQAKKRLFMFDYDGTLTPIVRDPAAAIPTDSVIQTIKSLASDPRNAVWIISGRDQDFLNKWMGDISELGLSAEHGCFIREPGNEEWENLTAKLDMSWQNDVMEIFQSYTERTEGSQIERKKVALTWHYRRADPEYGAAQARECQSHLENTVAKKWEVEVMSGKANVEVRPKLVNKGFIAKRLVKAYGDGPGQAPEFILCSGDDSTDEDMFRALRVTNLPQKHIFSVTVGASSKLTLAGWYLSEPADVIECISLLTNSGGDGGTEGNVDGKVVDAV